MIQKIKNLSNETFSSLSIPNFRRYFFGQSISMSGTFMQTMAQAWLVLEITHSGTALGFVMTLQYLPMFLLGPLGGMIVDRFSRRKILMLTKSTYGILALSLGIVVLLGIVKLWMIMLFALCMGIVNIFDGPASHAFTAEMVPADKIKNAITLMTSMINLSRVIGPSIGAIFIATVGIAACFIYNAISFLAVIAILLLVDRTALHKFVAVEKNKGQIFEGFSYVMSKPELTSVVVMIALIGTFTYEFPVSLAMLARNAFSGGADSYATLTAAYGMGAVLGGFIHARKKTSSSRTLVFAALSLGISVFSTALMPYLYLATMMMVMVGFCSIWFTTLAVTILQLGSTAQIRGRVMVIWSMFFVGSNAFGGPIIGWIGQSVGPRWALAAGGIAAIIAAGLGALVLQNIPARLEVAKVLDKS